MSVVHAGAGAQGFSRVFRFVRCFLIAGCSANTNTRGSSASDNSLDARPWGDASYDSGELTTEEYEARIRVLGDDT